MHTEVVFRAASCTSKTVLGGGTWYHFWKIGDWAAAFWIFVIVTRRIKASEILQHSQSETGHSLSSVCKLTQRWQDTHFKIE
jgi:hypothetical protein